MNPMNCHSTVPGSESMSSGSPSQFAALDFLFPGFSILSSAVQRYFKIDLNIYIPLVLLFGGLTFFVRYFSEYFWYVYSVIIVTPLGCLESYKTCPSSWIMFQSSQDNRSWQLLTRIHHQGPARIAFHVDGGHPDR